NVQVVTEYVNHPPSITSTPPLTATVGAAYSYDAQATDPDNDPLAWKLLTAPAGMSINPALGTIRWTPSADQEGNQQVSLQGVDPLGLADTQNFTTTVKPVDVPPRIVSTPPTDATVDQPYAYAVRAIDPDDDQLHFSLTAAPNGMAITEDTGLILWTPDST